MLWIVFDLDTPICLLLVICLLVLLFAVSVVGCLLGYSSCLVVWIPLFLDPSDGAFGRFELAALCGCRTLNFCLFVCLYEIDHCIAFGPCSTHHMTPTSTQYVLLYCLRVHLRLVKRHSLHSPLGRAAPKHLCLEIVCNGIEPVLCMKDPKRSTIQYGVRCTVLLVQCNKLWLTAAFF